MKKELHPAYAVLLTVFVIGLCIAMLSTCGGNRQPKQDPLQSAKDSLSGVIAQRDLVIANNREVIADYEEERNAAKIESAIWKSKYERAKASAIHDRIIVQQVVAGEEEPDTTTQADYCQPLLDAADSVIDSQQREIEVAVKELVVWASHDSTTRNLIAEWKRKNELSEEQLANMRKGIAKAKVKSNLQTAGYTIMGAVVGFGGGYLTGKFTK